MRAYPKQLISDKQNEINIQLDLSFDYDGLPMYIINLTC